MTDHPYISPQLRHLAVAIDSLHEDPANARKHNEKNLSSTKASLKQFGQLKPIVVRASTMTVEAGNGTLRCARELGWTHIAANLVDHNAVEATSYAIADNRTAELATWDYDALGSSLDALKSEQVDLESLGWSDAELNAIIPRDEDEQSRADKLPDDADGDGEAMTSPGDLWVLGDHRILCGDSTSADDVARLLDGETPLMMVTDPPYGVEYDASWRIGMKGAHNTLKNTSLGRVKNDGRSSWVEALSLAKCAVLYCWHAGTKAHVVGNDLESLGYEIRSHIIWVKPSLVPSRGHYNLQHEPCWYAVQKSATSNWSGDAAQSTVWDIGKGVGVTSKLKSLEDMSTEHSTQKPVECMARPIRNHGKRGDAVYDPFLGSGTTLIACEMLGRRCYGMEIHPPYVDICVKRWEKFTGRKAVRDGETT